MASFLSDRFGRMKVSMIAGSLAGLMGLVDPFIPNIYGFLVGRAVVSFFVNLVTPPVYVLSKPL